MLDKNSTGPSVLAATVCVCVCVTHWQKCRHSGRVWNESMRWRRFGLIAFKGSESLATAQSSPTKFPDNSFISGEEEEESCVQLMTSLPLDLATSDRRHGVWHNRSSYLPFATHQDPKRKMNGRQTSKCAPPPDVFKAQENFKISGNERTGSHFFFFVKKIADKWGKKKVDSLTRAVFTQKKKSRPWQRCRVFLQGREDDQN